ncbi:acetyl-CoA carboxylase biotin carboxyl carrier protein [Clostridium sp. MB40-C1]|uniref:acetyl-CoA carboxylase biotin carboxyl carrier protein n=1 Tax=Clostridium sp. MB40-C1 TaxID=3070996 RepID=UPI0027DEE582|nr:acetyl-CoA carboxylase biotin carboxyl carrier protein [Clostridium sp. MB40-C1]WMJ80130.1 acetyl-CoA carboxylase biotin carboxyl carrier protein [Clostridium sp. MB40-C1]
MDYRDIKDIIKLMSESRLTSLEIETEEISIKMKKTLENEGVPVIKENQNDINKNEIMQEISLENSNLAIEKQEESLPQSIISDNIITIKSPIVGTYYSSPAPGEENFVKEGSKVQKGETLCIIEAMKLMNEIEAEDDYEIVQILVKNEDMVEYGQPIFNVKKI